MSHHLVVAGIDHVVLERDEVGASWRAERWDSLRLLTPNWMTRLPGHAYQGDDPDGFMAAAEVVAFLQRYRAGFDGPVVTGVTVHEVRVEAGGFRVGTDQGPWTCDAVVAATGGSSTPRVPSVAAALPRHLVQVQALAYRRPDQLDGDREILVVGASASGVQIA